MGTWHNMATVLIANTNSSSRKESDTFFQSAGLKLKLPNRTFQEISNVPSMGKWMKAVFENMFYYNVPLPLPAHQHRSLQKMEDIRKAAPDQCSFQTLNGQQSFLYPWDVPTILWQQSAGVSHLQCRESLFNAIIRRGIIPTCIHVSMSSIPGSWPSRGFLLVTS